MKESGVYMKKNQIISSLDDILKAKIRHTKGAPYLNQVVATSLEEYFAEICYALVLVNDSASVPVTIGTDVFEGHPEEILEEIERFSEDISKLNKCAGEYSTVIGEIIHDLNKIATIDYMYVDVHKKEVIVNFFITKAMYNNLKNRDKCVEPCFDLHKILNMIPVGKEKVVIESLVKRGI